jgi:hypothetical protein
MHMRRIAAGLLLLATAAAAVESQAQGSDPFQRYFVIHNTLGATIYPVIQAPQSVDKGVAVNCGSVPGAGGARIGGLMRIVVNMDASTPGVPSGQSVTVAIPKEAPGCPQGAFYTASRIFMLTADFELHKAMLNPDQRTRPYPDWPYAAPCAGCWVGIAAEDPARTGADYGYDVPGQLLEYTIISQNPADGSAFPSANDTRGRSLIDFDVSYVDYAHLPFAMAIGDGGATQFMGSTFGDGGSLPNSLFATRLSNFVSDATWSAFAAYAPVHWASDCSPPLAPDGGPKDIAKTRFSCLVPRVDVAPATAILIATARDGGGSSFFMAQTYGGYSTLCVDPKGANAQCAVALPNNVNCCPDPVNGMQGCCDIKNFQIDKVLGHWTANPDFPTDPSKGTQRYSNPTLDDIVARFDKWQGALTTPCADGGAGIREAPVIDQKGFCNAYKRTVDFVWKDFVGQCAGKKGTALDQCTVQKIIGYDKNSGYDPNKCINCVGSPDTCPASCVNEQMSNESVQALQRGLPWTPAGPPAECSACPSHDLNACPAKCVFPKDLDSSAKLYHYDKFLHFWAPTASVYSLNPYARFVHSPDGAAAPGAYSFSIDDFYGNFGGLGSTLVIQAGGFSKLPNREPFDPYQQDFANMGTGWDHAKVCGRTYRLPPNTPAKVGLSSPLSFWNEGTQSTQCEVFIYPTADESKYVTFLVKEVSYNVVDQYTGHTQTVKGLSGVYAPRGGASVQDPYCAKNSTAQDLVAKGLCNANMSAGTLNKAYVGVSDAGCTNGNDWTCGRPMVNLNTPALTAVGVRQTIGRGVERPSKSGL